MSKTGSLASTLGTLNPFRYRGYIYDEETGLYYCNSRYYDPVVCRWLNADGQISGIGGDALGYNQFAYCFNNPVKLSDSTGEWPKFITKAASAIKKFFTKRIPTKNPKATSKTNSGFANHITKQHWTTPTLATLDFEANIGLLTIGAVALVLGVGSAIVVIA